jgi:hypothetical protein
MLKRYWFATKPGLGYGVTAESREEAAELLRSFGYPRNGEAVLAVTENIDLDTLDPKHIMPNAGPSVVRGVWFPRHNV